MLDYIYICVCKREKKKLMLLPVVLNVADGSLIRYLSFRDGVIPKPFSLSCFSSRIAFLSDVIKSENNIQFEILLFVGFLLGFF